MSVSVKDLMKKEVITIDLKRTALEAARLMDETDISCLIVTEDDKPVGIVSERDFLTKILAQNIPPSEVAVEKIMSKPLISIKPNASLKDAARLMQKHDIHKLAVLEESKLVGILTLADFRRHMNRITLEEILYFTVKK